MGESRTSSKTVYFEIVNSISHKSYSLRGQVGAILVRDGRIVSTGYNGMPTGLPNTCELDLGKEHNINGVPRFRSYDEVIHAEINAILFAARTGQATEDTVLYCSFSPCIECAKAIIQAGITEVNFIFLYTTDKGKGVKLLETVGIKTLKFEPDDDFKHNFHYIYKNRRLSWDDMIELETTYNKDKRYSL